MDFRRCYRGPVMRLVLFSLTLSTAACLGVDATETSGQCMARECPAGTAPKELREVSGSYDIGLGFDPLSYKAEGAFKTFGEGKCEYACQLIQACPDRTFPVMTQACFTCGVLTSSNTVAQGSCSAL